MSESESLNEEGKAQFEKYSEYNRTLRAWLVAFGFGIPATILVNEKIAQKLSDAGELRFAVALFLVGAVSQILIAFLNKMTAWSCYYGQLEKSYQSTRRFKFGLWLSHQMWVDGILDIASMLAFGFGVWKVFNVFAQ